MLTREQEQKLAKYNFENIPNGGLLYNEMTNWIYKNYPNGFSIDHEFMRRVADRLMEIAYYVINHEIRANTVEVPVWCYDYFFINEDILNIEVYWYDKWNSEFPNKVKKYSAFLQIPINLHKPLGQLKMDWHIDDNVQEIADGINKHIIDRIEADAKSLTNETADELDYIHEEVKVLLEAFGYKPEVKVYSTDSGHRIIDLYFHVEDGSEDMPPRYKDAISMLAKGYLSEFYYESNTMHVKMFDICYGLYPNDDRYSCLLHEIRMVDSCEAVPEKGNEIFINMHDHFKRHIIN